jgi:hypothetical protein
LLKAPCPDAVEFNCLKNFRFPSSAKIHGIRNHRLKHIQEYKELHARANNRHRRRTRKQGKKIKLYLCPDATEFKCTSTFYSWRSAYIHGITWYKAKHIYAYEGMRFSQYESRRRRRERDKIIKSVKKDGVPSPGADEFNCAKTFTRPDSAKRHAKTSHKKEIKDYTDTRPLREFAEERSKETKRAPCPRAKQFACPQIFSTALEAKDPESIHTKLGSKDVQNSNIATGSDGSTTCYKVLRRCTVPDCRHTISEMRMSEADMTRHLSQHAAGYFKNLQLYPPMATDELQTEEMNELLEILDSTLGEAGDKDSRSIGMQLTLDTHAEIGIQGVRLHRAAQFQVQENEDNNDTAGDDLEYIKQCYRNQNFHQPTEPVVAENMKMQS